jgi:putative iron-regulated protein
MKRLTHFMFYFAVLTSVVSSCKKDTETAADTSTVQGEILNDFTTNIAIPNLTALSKDAETLNTSIQAFVSAPTQGGLLDVQQKWYATRVTWELSEAFLFGPVATLDLDPSIDSWPVNFVDIDSVISNQANVFTVSFMDSLESTLKGFHPIEYLIFGNKGQRNATDLSARQLDYLAALGAHIKRVTAQMIFEWKADGGNFGSHISGAGQAGSQYSSQKEALLEIANAMIGIIDEVGSGKIEEPLFAKDPSLEESPFSQNSWTDFTNNIRGARNVYTGKYVVQGKGLTSFVNQYNKSLDLQIQQKLDACIANLAAHTVPFGTSIINQPSAVQATQSQLSDLKDVLENQLIPLIQQQAK